MSPADKSNRKEGEDSTRPAEAAETGAQHAEAYLAGTAEGSSKCTLIRELFSHCSYCSTAIGSGSSWFGGTDTAARCSRCGWVYCKECIDHDDDDGSVCCSMCRDADTWKNRAIPKAIHSVRSAVVIGAGLGGLAAALGLKRRGVASVTVLEKSPVLRTAGGAITVLTNAMRALLDLDPDVMAETYDRAGALNTPGVYARAEDQEVLMKIDMASNKESRWGNPESRAIVRGHLQQILYDACVRYGVRVLFGHSCVRLDQKADTDEQVRVEVEIASSAAETKDEDADGKNDEGRTQEQFVADLVIAADGLWSALRQQLFPECPKPAYVGFQMLASVTSNEDFDNSDLACFSEHWGKGHRLGYFKCGEGGTAWYYARNCAQSYQQEATKEELKRAVVDDLTRFGYAEPLRTMTAASDPEKVYRFVIRHMPSMEHFAKGRIVLLGDAANGMPPTLGQGACMALESASILSQALVCSETLPQAIRKFEKRRIQRCALVAKQSKDNGAIFQAGNFLTVWMRNSLFRYLGSQANRQDLNQKDLPDPFAYLFSYRLVSWPIDPAAESSP